MLVFWVHSSQLDVHKDAKGNDVFWRDFCLVRRLMPANRITDGPFPYEKCEVRDANADPNMPWLPVRDRLGMLWVWAKDVNDGPIYEVLTAEEVVEVSEEAAAEIEEASEAEAEIEVAVEVVEDAADVAVAVEESA